MAFLSLIFTRYSCKGLASAALTVAKFLKTEEVDNGWAWASNRSTVSRSNPLLMAGITAVPQHFTHFHSPCLSLHGSPSLHSFFFFCFWFVSICFISAVPSFLPFQKVMHTRKRHSELYHELNHSSKFHTIDRYSRDPAMSTFKVRSLPRGRMGTHCTRAPPPPILYNT